MESKTDWVPAGLDGVCLPATWTAEDHRGMNTVLVYRGTVKGATDGSIVDLVKNGTIGMEQVYAAEIPRKPEWLGY
jgi:branched-chain amino acid transport system substrate-binding protein